MEALLQKKLGDGFLVESAGTEKSANGKLPSTFAVMCMKERGLNISGHKGRWIQRVDLTQFSFIVCTDWAAKKVVEITPRKGGTQIIIANEDGDGIPNPLGMAFGTYRKCAELLDNVIPGIANQIGAM